MASKISIGFDFSKDKKRVEKFKDAFATAGVDLDEAILEGKSHKEQVKILRTTLAEAVESAGEKRARKQGASRKELTVVMKNIQDSTNLDDATKSKLMTSGSSLLESNVSDPVKLFKDSIATTQSIIASTTKDTRTAAQKMMDANIDAAADAGGDAEAISQVKFDLDKGTITPIEASAKLGGIKKAASLSTEFRTVFSKEAKKFSKVLTMSDKELEKTFGTKDKNKIRESLRVAMLGKYPDYKAEINSLFKREPGKVAEGLKALMDAIAGGRK